jgi:hypothetical protein
LLLGNTRSSSSKEERRGGDLHDGEVIVVAAVASM